jgi:integrase
MTDNPERIRVGDRVTIYPRGTKKVWCADFWQDGQHRRQSLKTANRKVALQKAMKLEVELAAGTFHRPAPSILVRQASDDYLRYLETEQRAKKTLVKYRGILDNLVAFLQQQRVTRLAQVTVTHFDRFRAWRKPRCHPKTMYTEGVVIKQLFRWARSRKLISENPLAELKLAKPPLEPRPGPSLEQVNRILEALSGPQRTQIAVLAFSGMRSGELKRLRPEDLDLEGGWLHICSREGAETKTRLSRRVPIHPRLRPLLQALPGRRRPWLFTMPASSRYPQGDHQLNTKKLNETFLEMVHKLGMPTGRKQGGYTLHSLRHFFETYTVNAGIPQRVIDTWLGHRSDRSMASIYYLLSDADSQKFMSQVPFGPVQQADPITQELKP